MAINESGGIKVGGGDDVKVSHGDPGQNALNQLMTQNQPAVQADNTPINAEHPTVSLLDAEGVGGASVAPVFIQPDEAGKFQFTKVEYINTIHEDKLVEQNTNLSFNAQGENVGSGHSEFAQQNFGVNLQTLAGSDLAFNKIYFGGTGGPANFTHSVEGLQNFGGGATIGVAHGVALAGTEGNAAAGAAHGAIAAGGGGSAATAAIEAAAPIGVPGSVAANADAASGGAIVQAGAPVDLSPVAPVISAPVPVPPVTPTFTPVVVTPPPAPPVSAPPTPVVNVAPTVVIPPAAPTPTGPAITAGAMQMSMVEDQSITINSSDILAHVTDVTANANLAITNLTSPSGVLVNNNDGTWTFTPNAGFHGNLNLQYTASDGTNTASSTISIAVADVAPTTQPVSYTMNEDSSIIISSANLLSVDSTLAGNTLSVTSIAVPANQGSITDNGDGTWTYKPAIGFAGQVTLQATVSDGTLSATQAVNVTVNDVPPVAHAVTYSMTEDGTLIINPSLLIAQDTAPAGNTLSVTNISVPPSQGSIVFDATHNLWTFTPATGFVGALTLQATVADNYGATTTQAINVNVGDVAPVTTAVNYSITEDSSITINPASLLAVDSTLAGNTLSISNITVPASEGTVAQDIHGNWIFTPAVGFVGTANLSATVVDNNGLSATQPVNVAVGDVAPLTTAVNYSMTEDGSFTINPASLLAVDSTLAGNTLSVANITVPANEGTLVHNADGSWTFNPATGFAGTANLIATVTDNHGLSSTQPINIAVNDVAPTAMAVSYSMTEDGSFAIHPASLIAVDSTLAGNTLSVTNMSVPANEGSVNLVNGNWIFTPATGFVGTANLTATITDNHGLSTTQPVNIAVSDIAPVTAAVTYSMNEDGSFNINPANLVAVDSTLAGNTLSITNITVPANEGSVSLVNGNWVFTPATGFAGIANLSATVTDNHGLSAAQAVNIAVNDIAPVTTAISYTMPENGTITIDPASLLAVDSTLAGNTLSITSLSVPANEGTLVHNADGTWSFTPANGFVGSLSLQATVTDNHGLSTPQAINIGVSTTAISTSPVSYTMTEDGSLIINPTALLANDAGPAGTTLSIANITVPANEGTIVHNADGTWTFSPATGFAGSLTLQATVSDGQTTAPQSINIAVNDIAPVTHAISYSMTEDGSFTINPASLLAVDATLAGNTLSITNITVPANEGTLVHNADGSWTFSPAVGFVGTANLIATVTDNNGLSAAQPVNIAVNDVAPITHAVSYSMTEDGSLNISPASLLAADSTLAGNTLSITNITVPANEGALVHNADGSWTFNPATGFVGTANLMATVTDNNGLSSTQAVNVGVGDVAPVTAAVNYSMTEDGSFTINPASLLAVDATLAGNTLSITNITVPANEGALVHNADGSWTFSPAVGFVGTANLIATVTDNNGLSAAQPVNIAVNDVAPITHAVSYSMTEDGSLNISPASLLAADSTLAGNTLSITNLTVPANEGSLIHNADGSWTFNPATGFVGTANLMATVTDNNGLSSTQAVNVGVGDVAPVTAAVNYSMTEDGSFTINPASLLAVDATLAGNTLSITNITVPANEGSLVHNADGSWTFSPAVGFVGTANLIATVTDNHGLSATQPVNIAVNDVAPITHAVSYSMTEDGSLNISPASLLAADSTLAGNTLSITNITVPANEGALVHNADGSWTFNPATGFVGTANLVATVTDNNGLSSTQAVNVGVGDVAPVTAAVNYSMNEDTSITISPANLLAADSTLAGNTLSITNLTVPANEGTLVLNANGTYTFTAATGFVGTANLIATVTDNNGLSSTQPVNIAVNDVAPITSTVSFSMTEDGSLVLNPSLLIAHDIAPAGNTLSITNISVPANEGTISYDASHNLWTFTPVQGFAGSLTLQATVTDNNGGSAIQNINVSVGDLPPTTASVNYSMTEDGSFTISPASLLAVDSTLAGNTLSITNITVPANEGTLVHNADGSWTFNPATGFVGTANLSATVTDNHGLSSAQAVNIAVNDVAPVTHAVSYSMTEDGSFTINPASLLAADSTLAGNTLSITNITVPANEGALVHNANGTWTFNPATGFVGTANLMATVTDNNGLSTPQAINIAVSDVAPVTSAVNYSMNEDGSFTISPANLLAVDATLAGNTLSISNITVPANEGTVTLNNGNWVFTPATGFVGTANLIATVTDNNGLSTPQAVNIAVNDVAPITHAISYSMTEDGSFTINPASLLAVDSTLAGNTLSITNITVPANEGALVHNADGSWTFNPATGFVGTANLIATVTDNNGLSTPQAVNIAVSDVAPITHAVSYSMTEDGSFTISPASLLAADSTLAGNTLSITNITVPANEGALVHNADGSWTFNPATGFVGTANLIATVTDNNGLSTPQAVNIAVSDVAPVTQAVSYSMTEDGSFTINPASLLAVDSTLAGNTLSITNLTVPANEGSLVHNADGSWTFNAATGFVGTANLVATVTDNNGLSSTQAVNIGIGDVAPVTAAVNYSMNEDGTFSINPANLLAVDSTLAGNTISVTGLTVPANEGSVAFVNGNWVFTPATGFVGTANLSATITDNHGLSSTQPINIAVNDVAPATQAVSYSMNEDGTYSINPANLIAVDSTAAGNTLSVTNITVPANEGTVTLSNGNWIFSPASGFVGTANLTATVSDNHGLTASQAVNITVNDVPPTVQTVSYSMNEDASYTINPANLIAVDSTVAGNTLSITNVTVPANEGSVTLSNGNWIFTPATGFVGVANLTATVSDGHTTVPQAVNITVNDVPPTTTAVNYTMNEDGTLTINPANLIAVDSTVAGNTLSITNITVPANEGSVTLSNGNWIFTPATGFVGTANLTATVSDGHTTVPQAVNITVSDVAPTVAQVNYSMNEDGSFSINPANLIAVDSTVAGNTLSITNITVPANEGTVTLSNGNWIFTPAIGFVGTANLTATVSDGHVTVPQAVNITVNDVAPTVQTVAYSMNEDASYTINPANLIAVDSTVAGNTLSITNITVPANEGSVTLSNGNWIFTPATGFVGVANLTATVSDGHTTVPQAVNITVNDVPPTVHTVSYSMNEDASYSINPANLIAVDSTVAGNTLSITNITVPANQGSVSLSNGNWIFTPATGFVGTANLTATVSDGHTTVPQAVNITVNDVAPTTASVSYSMNEDGTFNISPANLLAVDSTVAGNTISITAMSVPANEGSVSLVNGNWVFTPATGFVGTANLSATVTDNHGVSTPQAVNIAVNDVPPTVQTVSYSMNENGSLTINPANLLSVDSTVAGNTLSITNISAPANEGTVSFSNGNWIFTPNTGFFGTTNLTATVSDGHTSVPQAVNVTVINDVITTNPVSYTMNEDGSIIISASNLLAQDSSSAGDTLSITALSVPANQGTIVDNHNGTYTYTPATGFVGTLDLTATVSDGTITAPQTVHMTINDVAPTVQPVAYTITEDQTLTIKPSDILGVDTTVAGNTLSIANMTVPASQGTMSYDSVHNVWNFIPKDDFVGQANITATISDGHTTVSQAVNVTINPDVLSAAPVSLTMNEDGALSITQAALLANVHPADADDPYTLTITKLVTQATHQGTVSYNSTTHTWTYVPVNGFVGNITLVATVQETTADQGTLTTTQNINVTVVDVPPTTAAVNYSMNEDGTFTINPTNLLAVDSDVAGNTMSITAMSVPANEGTVVHSGTNWIFTPATGFVGTANIIATVTDNNGGSSAQAVNITVNDIAPTTATVTYSMNEDGSFSINPANLLAVDSTVAGNTISISNITVPASQGTVSFDAVHNTWTFNPATGFVGTANLTATVMDNNGVSTAQAVNIAVNDVAPTVGTATYTMNEDATLIINPNDVLAVDSTVAGNTLSITNMTVPTAQGKLTHNADGTWSFVAKAGFVGAATITATVSDGHVTVAQPIAITVNDVAPTTATVAYSMNEDGTFTINPTNLLNVDSAVTGNTISITNMTVDPSQGTVVHSGSNWIFTPVNGFVGTANIIATVTDNNGGSTPQAVNITVNDIAPTTATVAYSMNEDGTFNINPANLLAVDSDVAGDTISVTGMSVPAGQGSVALVGGNWVFTPTIGFVGTANITATITDNHGVSTAQAVNITVNDVAPTVQSVSYAMNENAALTINPANIIAVDSTVAGNTLSITAMSATHGTVTQSGGNWIFTPAANYVGPAVITATVSDGHTTVPQTINVSVNAPPVVPVVNMTLTEGGSLTFTSTQLLANVTNLDGDALTISSVSGAANGTIVNNGTVNGVTSWTYTPAAGYMGTDQIQFTVSDTDGAQVTQNLNLMAEENSVIQSETTAVTALNTNNTVTISAAELTSHAFAIEGDTLSVSGLTAANGTLVDNHDGTWTFTPGSGYTGEIPLQYTLSDGTASITQGLTLEVGSSNAHLQFNVDDNLNLIQPAQTGHNYSYTDSLGVTVQTNYSNPDSATISVLSNPNAVSTSVDVTDAANAANNVTVTGFNTVNADLDSSKADTLTVNNADSGNITMSGSANDTLNITTSSTADAHNNTFNVSMGAGDEHFNFTGNNASTAVNVFVGDGKDAIALQGSYASANVFLGKGQDTITGGHGDTTVHFGNGENVNDTFTGNSTSGGWADSVMIDSHSAVAITQTSNTSWTLVVDGQTAHLTSSVAGTVVNNHIDFAGHANGTLTMGDGGTLHFNHVDHVEW